MTIDLGRELQAIKDRLDRMERSARLSHASIDDTSVQVRDATGGLRGLLGVQADGTTAVNIVNGAAPPQPSAPIVASVLGGVTVSWDGQFTDGAVLPLDWARVEVHASILSSYEPIPATLQGTIETAQGATVVVPVDTDVYVRLVARNTSGAASTPSTVAGPYGPTPVVADDIADGIVTTLKLAAEAVTEAKIAAGAVVSGKLANGAVLAAKLADAAVEVEKIASGAVTSPAIATDAVTAGKIAADAITAREITAGSVTASEIAADAVTTEKIIAGAILAGQIAAGAVLTDKLAAEAVTAAKIAALTITADQIAANAITVGKLSAGAVDATALAADAITGKTITGGTITGSFIQTAASGERITLNASGLNKVLVHNSAGLAIGELSSNGLAVKGTNGSVLQLDPNNTFPNLRLTNAAGTNSAIINVSGATALLGTNSGLFTDRGYTDMKWRNLQGGPATDEGFAVIEQVRDSNANLVYGGRLYLDTEKATLGYVDTDDTTQNTTFFVLPNYAQLLNARLDIFPTASSGSAVYVNAASGHTGNLLRLALNGADKFVVDEDGNVTILGIGQRLFARKTSDATARTSTTPSADPHLSVALSASATYRLEGFLKWSGDSASDINLGWNTPASAAGSWVCYGGDAAMSAVPATMRIIDTAINSTRSYGVISTVTGQAIRGTVRTTTAGTLSLNWGAQTAGGTGISILTDSWIYLERVE